MASCVNDCPAHTHLLATRSWPHALICPIQGSPWVVSRLTAGTGRRSKCPGCTARCWTKGFSGYSLVYSDRALKRAPVRPDSGCWGRLPQACPSTACRWSNEGVAGLCWAAHAAPADGRKKAWPAHAGLLVQRLQMVERRRGRLMLGCWCSACRWSKEGVAGSCWAAHAGLLMQRLQVDSGETCCLTAGRDCTSMSLSDRLRQ